MMETKQPLELLNKAAENHSKLVWGEFHDDFVKDYGIDQTNGEISQKDFITGALSHEAANGCNKHVEELLLNLVDTVWGIAHEDESVPSTEWAKKMIAKARNASYVEDRDEKYLRLHDLYLDERKKWEDANNAYQKELSESKTLCEEKDKEINILLEKISELQTKIKIHEEKR